MASRSDDESVTMQEEPVVRRTRSGRAVKSLNSPVPKTRGRKKVSVSEEVSEGEDIPKQAEFRKEYEADLSENSNGLPHLIEESVSETEIETHFEESVEEAQYVESPPDQQQFEETASELLVESTTVQDFEVNSDDNCEYPNQELSDEFLNTIENNTMNSDDHIYPNEVEEPINTSESEMDADEENVDNEIIEISGGTGDRLVSNDAQIESREYVTEDTTMSEDNQESTDQVESSPEKQVLGDSNFENDEEPMVQDEAENTDKDVSDADAEPIRVSQQEVDDTTLENTDVDKSMEVKEDPDTEMVSEDELPAPPKAKVPEDAEEVSDDELPGPKLAELPADTEVVSEDELPTVKAAKRKHEEESGYDPSSPTGAQDSSSNCKRPALDSSVEAKDEKDDKKATSKPRKLPELDKYWKAVRDDPSDFTGWTYLLQYVDQENEIEPAREAYDAFLAHYPYCYGYWRKYADYEKRKGNKKKCEEVFERGLRAIPLSVDLWLHFLTYQKTTYGEDETRIREQFERALNACGLEFRSDRLWEGYIKWETEGKRLRRVMEIYDRLLATPTFGYTTHFDSFQEFVSISQPPVILSREEFLSLRAESRTDKDAPVDSNIPPVEDEADDNMRSDEESEAIKQLIIAERRKVHKCTTAEVTARWSFEEGIKRPYFHVKPLERCQLNNWKDYLDYETQNGSRQRVLILYERCLIACALYEEFWLRLIRYLELQHDESLVTHTRDVFERACNVHHPDKPTLHLLWAAFEENNNQHNKAADILVHIEKTCPNVLQIAYRRINLERRRGDFEKCSSLFEHYIQTLKNKSVVAGLVIKYARFCHKVQRDMTKAAEVLKAGIERDPSNARLSLQLIDLYMQRDELDLKEIVEVLDAFLAREPDVDQRVLFAQRKLEFLEDFGTAESLQEAQRSLQQALAKANKKKDSKRDSSPSKKQKDGPAPPLPPTNSYQSTNSSQYGSPYNTSQSAGVQSANAYGGYPAHGSYNQGYAQSSGEYPPYQWGQYSQGQYSGGGECPCFYGYPGDCNWCNVWPNNNFNANQFSNDAFNSQYPSQGYNGYY